MKSIIAFLTAAAMWTAATVLVYQGSDKDATGWAVLMLVTGTIVCLIFAIGYDVHITDLISPPRQIDTPEVSGGEDLDG